MSEEAHGRFIKRLDSSRPSMFRVAEWLHADGYSVHIPSIQYAPFGEDPEKYFDAGDLFVKKGLKEYRIEVKHKNLDFTGIDDWPLKEKTLLIANKTAVDRENGMAKAFIIVNNRMTHAGIVWRHTRERWHVVSKFATNTQKNEEFYEIDLQYVDFRKLSHD